MIQYLNRKNTHDFIHQYHWLKPSQKVTLVQCDFNTNNNNLIRQPKLINPIFFSLNLFLTQKPSVKTAKKSIAAFKVRMNTPIGTKNHLHKQYLENFYQTFIISLLPSYGSKKINYNSQKNNNYNINLSYGIKNINNPILKAKDIYYPFLDGAHLQWNFKSPIKTLPFYYM